MAREAWAPQEKKGESRKDYQKRYYSAQREHAEETGDQKTTDKIYAKAGKKSHSVDANASDKAILGTVAGGSLGKLGKLAKVGRGALSLGETKALPAGAKRLSGARAGMKAMSGGKVRVASGVEKGSGRVGAQKALGKGMAHEAESPTTMKNVTPKVKRTGRTNFVEKGKARGKNPPGTHEGPRNSEKGLKVKQIKKKAA